MGYYQQQSRNTIVHSIYKLQNSVGTVVTIQICDLVGTITYKLLPLYLVAV